MEIIRYEYGKALDIAPSVIALGFFDGVTVAHRRLMSAARAEARRRGIAFGVFTFYSDDPIKRGVDRIYSTEEKLLLLERCEADFTVLAEFEELASLSPEEFVNKILLNDLGAECAAYGYNFRFGKGASGDADLLTLLMKQSGKDSITVTELTDGGAPISSTLIRAALADKDIEKANRLLGTPYFIRGRVSGGNKKGRELGFPTVNTSIEAGRATPTGVFRSCVPIDGRLYHSVTNIGRCPTLGAREIHAETHILSYSGDLYERELEIYLLGFLREERSFDSVGELCRQIEEDKIRTVKENGELSWQRLGLK